MLTNAVRGPFHAIAELRVRMLLVLTPVDVCQVTQAMGLLTVKVSSHYPPYFICCSGFSKVKSAYESSGPSRKSLSRFLQHERTRSISTALLMGC